MYGARFVGAENTEHVKKALSHGSIAMNDFVTLKTDGQVEPTALGEPIDGIALGSVTGAGQTVYYITGHMMRVLLDNDNVGTTFAATHVGARFDAGGATGVQIVDTSTAAQAGSGADTGNVYCLEYNPQGYGFDADTSIGLFSVAEREGEFSS